jgi:polyhydroxybutyrate depolymerase
MSPTQRLLRTFNLRHAGFDDLENRVHKPPPFVALVLAVVAVLASASLAVAATPTHKLTRRRDSAHARKTVPNRLSPGSHTLSITVGGLQRTFIVDVPTGKAKANRALVLVYHGATDTAANTVTETDMLQQVSGHGDLIAFLQGFDDTWNEGSGSTPARTAHVNDVAFTADVIARMRILTTFDPSRVAAVGISNGAIMVEDLGCHLSGRISLIVPVEGQMSTVQSSTCSLAKPENVYEIHGTTDPEIPYAGGYFSSTVGHETVLSAPNSVARWAQLDGCSTGPATSSPNSTITLSTYSQCRDGAFVTLESIIGGQHAWPTDIGELVVQELSQLPK